MNVYLLEEFGLEVGLRAGNKYYGRNSLIYTFLRFTVCLYVVLAIDRWGKTH